MTPKPLGFYVLIEMEKVEDISQGGIILGDVSREQDATQVGYVRAIGPTAFEGYPGCEYENNYQGNQTYKPVYPHEKWGLYVGQRVEYRKFEGKTSAAEGYENYRYIPDSHIIGAIEDE